MAALAAYLPDGCFGPVVAYIHQHKIYLTVTRQRRSILGDFRHATHLDHHRISINGDLNKYEFLLTFLHELSHLITFEQYRNRVEPHGKEWKANFGELLKDFLGMGVFPPVIAAALRKTVANPAATANGETELLAVLRQFDTVKKEGVYTIGQLPDGTEFITENGRRFKKIGKRRKRYECVEIETGRRYSFSELSEVRPLT